MIMFMAIQQSVWSQGLIDKEATRETKALYQNLIRISEKGFLFGHQDTDAYGVGWRGDANRSDVKDVTGAYPAVHGWDLGKIGTDKNIDSVPFQNMIKWIQETYSRGGVNTISWHIDNPLTGESSWSKTNTVKELLPEGTAHEKYLEHLNHLAAFLDKCELGGVKIPIIFRPFHEHNGDWFWWGKGICTEEEYRSLWKFTVDYLRTKKNLHHLIYAFSPDRSRMDMNRFRESYLYGYPGDDYVDIIGYDNYWDVGSNYNKASDAQKIKDLVTGLKGISMIAAEKKKVAALTETGMEKISNQKWFTDVILNPIKSDPAIRIAYLMAWRNDREDHHYVPYKGHPAVENFLVFYRDKKTFFESDLQNLYQSNKPLIKK